MVIIVPTNTKLSVGILTILPTLKFSVDIMITITIYSTFIKTSVGITQADYCRKN